MTMDQKKYMAIEANIFNMGKEEPTTKPGLENSLNFKVTEELGGASESGIYPLLD